jgi:CheY-like chemotaxis protein/anti-sigma regulatory factor (Ser/Thr protein kinase)
VISPRQKTPAILVVDPDPGVREMLAVELHPEGWLIANVDDGVRGLSRLSTSPFDIVIAEAGSSGVGGIELVERIGQVWPETKVILMAAASEPREVVHALRSQAFGFLSKPVSAATLGETVRRAASSDDWRGDIQVLSARPEWLSIEIRCKLDVVDRLLPFLRALKMDISEQDREDSTTAVREVLMNAIEHGGRSNPQSKVRVSLVRTARAIIYYVRDPGPGFSFDRLPHAAISNPPESPLGHHQVRSDMGIRPGGFGILLTRSLVDELIYNETGNEVLIVKYLTP